MHTHRCTALVLDVEDIPPLLAAALEIVGGLPLPRGDVQSRLSRCHPILNDTLLFLLAPTRAFIMGVSSVHACLVVPVHSRRSPLRAAGSKLPMIRRERRLPLSHL